jgi:hypothetical protein
MAFWLALGIGALALLAAVVVWVSQLALAAVFGVLILRGLADGPAPEKERSRRLPSSESARGSSAWVRRAVPAAGR